MAYEPSSASAPNAVHRLKDRGRYDEETINSILDEGNVAHVTFKLPEDDANDWPVVIPMVFARQDDTIFLHGHLSSRLLKALSEDDVKCCITVTTVQGLIVSLTPFHNSNNYSSCILFGYTRLVADVAEKTAALTLITNAPFRKAGGDRWADSRPPSTADIQSTRVVAFKIEMASAKVRQGGPKDEKKDIEDADVAGKYWSGHLVREERWAAAIPSDYCKIEAPDYIKRMIGS